MIRSLDTLQRLFDLAREGETRIGDEIEFQASAAAVMETARRIVREHASAVIALIEARGALDWSAHPDLQAKVDDIVTAHRDPPRPNGPEVTPLELLDIATRLSSMGEYTDAQRLRVLADAKSAAREVSDYCGVAGCVHAAHGSPTWPRGSNPFVMAKPADGSTELPLDWFTLAVGEGSGQLFVYGPHGAIKAVQRRIMASEAEKAKCEAVAWQFRDMKWKPGQWADITRAMYEGYESGNVTGKRGKDWDIRALCACGDGPARCVDIDHGRGDA